MPRATACAALLMLALAGCEPAAEQHWLQGYAEGEYVRLAAPEAGWLESVAVERGDQVAAGALLYRLEAGRQRAAVAAAEAAREQAQAELADLRRGDRPEEIAQLEANLAEVLALKAHAAQDLRRQERLARTDVAARAKLDEARARAAETGAQVAAAEARLATARLPARADRIAAAVSAVTSAEAVVAEAEWALDQRTVRAPAAARVEDRLRQPGEWVDAGGVVLSLLPPDRVKVRFFVPEPVIAAVRVGQPVALRCGGCAPDLRGTVRYVAPDAEYTPPVIYSLEARSKLVFMVEAWPDVGARLHPGQPVDVDLGATVAQAQDRGS